MCFVFYHTHKRTPCLETSSDAALSGIPQAVASSQVPGDLFSKFLLEKECKTELPGHFKSWNDGRETILTSRSQAWRQGAVFASKDMTAQSTHQPGVPRGSCPRKGTAVQGRAHTVQGWPPLHRLLSNLETQSEVRRTTGKAPTALEGQREPLGFKREEA